MTDRHNRDWNGTDTATPGRAGERIWVLDVIRGFTLIGVLLVNVSDFTRNDHTGLDPWWYKALGAATGGKFVTLFQLMFGIGFAIQMSRWPANPRLSVPRYVVRCAALWLIGWAAEFFGGNGIILIAYATAALGLLPFRRVSARAALAWGVALALLHAGGLDRLGTERYRAWQDRSPVVAAAHQQARAAEQARIGELYRRFRSESDSYLRSRATWVRTLWERYRLGYMLPNLGMLALFLLGLAFWRSDVFTPTGPRPPSLPLAAVGAIVIGLGGQLALAAMAHAEGGALGVLNWLTTTLLALGYGTVVLLLAERGRLPRLFGLLQLQGRMGLTVFVLQGFAMSWIFNDWGLGLSQMSYRWDIPLTVVITVLIIALCAGWLSRVPQGPLEWIWRRITYGVPAIGPAAIASPEPPNT